MDSSKVFSEVNQLLKERKKERKKERITIIIRLQNQNQYNKSFTNNIFVFPWILKQEFSDDDLDSKSIEDIEYFYKFNLYLE